MTDSMLSEFHFDLDRIKAPGRLGKENGDISLRKSQSFKRIPLATKDERAYYQKTVMGEQDETILSSYHA